MPLPDRFKKQESPLDVTLDKVFTAEPPVYKVIGGSVDYPTEITLDEVGAKLKQLEDYAMTFLGQENCNPFMWRLQVIEPLMFQVQAEPSQELFAKILAMELVKPTV